jgi:undecaprenyl diphosphate synthase
MDTIKAKDTLPHHVGIIMDGNGRWAQQRFLPRIVGHNKGADRAKEIIEHAAKIGISTLTLFAFSDENWKRPSFEIAGLMNILKRYLTKEASRLIENKIKLNIMGDISKFPESLVTKILDLQEVTQTFKGMNLIIGLGYSGQGDVLRMTKRIAQKVKEGSLSLDDIQTSTLERNFDIPHLPPLDIIIRTSGEYRISNFILWHMAYAELFFTPCLWPDFDTSHFDELLQKYSQRKRTFGGLVSNIVPELNALNSVL